MSSIGNDIVALNYIDKQRTGERRFYSKILSPSEQELYHHHGAAVIPFHVYVWLLWSAKESVYKQLKRNQPHLVFSPVQIVVTGLSMQVESTGFNSTTNTLDELQGIGFLSLSVIQLQIAYQQNSFYTNSLLSDELIATVANNSINFDEVHWGIQRIGTSDYDHQSAQVRAYLLNNLEKLFPSSDLHIVKSDAGYPVVLDGANETVIKVSFAHHGNFVAYAFKLS